MKTPLVIGMSILLIGCIHQVARDFTFKDGTQIHCISDEARTSVINSAKITGCVYSGPSVPVISIDSGTSYADVAKAAAEIAGKGAMMEKRQPTTTPTPSENPAQ